MIIKALLPMKANSERVPGKNFKEFNNKPLFKWVLDNLVEIDLIKEIVINTDARNILEGLNVHKNSKIFIRDRKPEICGDFISMNEIIYDDIENTEANIFLMTHTTNPLLEKSTIVSAINKFKKALSFKEADSLFSVNKIQSRFYDKDTKPINHNPKSLLRTQDLEPWFEENSNFYLFTKESFIETRSRIGKKPIMHITNPIESIDIDTKEDWDLAEMISIQKEKIKLSKENI
tara:strand:+ start:3449 stop:4147 length:699 start_codon:yes stop_codon:yes gene_type:complete